MISRRWLVQSSAIGFFGATLLTMPLWMNSLTPDLGEEIPAADSQSSYWADIEETDPQEVSATDVTLRHLESTSIDDKDDGETTEGFEPVTPRDRLYDDYRGPMCPVIVETNPPEVLFHPPEHR